MSFDTCPFEYVVPSERKSVRIKKSHSKLGKIKNLINTMNQTADQAGYSVPEMGVYLQPIVQGTGMHCEFNLFYDPDNQIEINRVRQLSLQASKRLMNNGAFFSRPYGEHSAMVLNRDAATVCLLNKLKNMFDPNHIMNPGKMCF